MSLRGLCWDFRVVEPANLLHAGLALLRLKIVGDLVPELRYRVHELPDRHLILAQRIRADDLDLLEEVHAGIEDYFWVEENQAYDVVDRALHDEMALEHHQCEGVDLFQVFLELLDVLVVHRVLAIASSPRAAVERKIIE